MFQGSGFKGSVVLDSCYIFPTRINRKELPQRHQDTKKKVLFNFVPWCLGGENYLLDKSFNSMLVEIWKIRFAAPKKSSECFVAFAAMQPFGRFIFILRIRPLISVIISLFVSADDILFFSPYEPQIFGCIQQAEGYLLTKMFQKIQQLF